MRIILMIGVLVILAGCVSITPTLDPTLSPTTIPTVTVTATETPAPTFSPTPTINLPPLACTPPNALLQVDNLLVGETYEAHYLTINRQLVLSIWLVDSEIDLNPDKNTLSENTRQAFWRGATVAQQVLREIPCIAEVFQGINPMIVDEVYNAWYIDIIPLYAILHKDDADDEILLNAIAREGAETAYLRFSLPRRETLPPPGQACSWMEARATIKTIFEEERQNTAAYLIADYQTVVAYTSSQILVQVQWVADTPDEQSKESILAGIERVARKLACLETPVDTLELFVVDGDGWLFAHALVPGAIIREERYPVQADEVILYFLRGARP